MAAVARTAIQTGTLDPALGFWLSGTGTSAIADAAPGRSKAPMKSHVAAAIAASSA
jgi:hypothetical protein